MNRQRVKAGRCGSQRPVQRIPLVLNDLVAEGLGDLLARAIAIFKNPRESAGIPVRFLGLNAIAIGTSNQLPSWADPSHV